MTALIYITIGVVLSLLAQFALSKLRKVPSGHHVVTRKGKRFVRKNPKPRVSSNE